MAIFVSFSSLANVIHFQGAIVVAPCPTEPEEVKPEQCVPNTVVTKTLYKEVSTAESVSFKKVGTVKVVTHF